MVGSRITRISGGFKQYEKRIKKYRCEYHIVFATKFRRKVLYGELKKDIGVILRKLCNEKKIEIIEAEACSDHIHMLVSIPPYISIAEFVGYLKSKSALMIFDGHANLKYKYGNTHFWCRGYYVDTVGKNERIIKEYICNQLGEDCISDQMTLKEYMDQFTGSKSKLGQNKSHFKWIPVIVMQ